MRSRLCNALPGAGIAIVLLAAAACGTAQRPGWTPDQTVRIVALGDSTTAVYDWTAGVTEVYAQCLPQTLQARGIHALVFNAGIGNTTTREARERIARDVLPYHPDLVTIQFGINDSWIDADEGRTAPRLTRDEYRVNLQHIIRVLRAADARIILVTPNPMRWSDPLYIELFTKKPGLLDALDRRGINRLLDLYAQDVRDLARDEKLPLVDVHEAFEAYGRVPGRTVDELLLAGDGIHPNGRGQRLVCELLTREIVGMMRAGGGESYPRSLGPDP